MADDTPKKKRKWMLWTACALACCLVLGLAAGAAYHFIGRKVWTDDRSIRRPAAEAKVRAVLWGRAEPLPADLNTPRHEYEPSVSRDADALYFVRGLPGKGADLYVSRRDDAGRWSKPRPLDAVNTKHDELGPRLSPDGRFLLFYSDRPGGLGQYDIWASQKTAEGWGRPFNLGPAVNTKYNEYGPAMDPQGRRLYIATNRKAAARREKDDVWRATIRQGEIGDYDLFAAALRRPLEEIDSAQARPATAPASRPATAPAGEGCPLEFAEAEEVEGVNTRHHEGAPCVSPGGDFLYFASNRPGGLGGFDLYRCRLRGERCGKVRNLGGEVNTPENETDPQLAMGGFQLFFSSDRDESRGGYDLFVSRSREVYAVRQRRPLPHLGWSWWALLIALALLVPLLLFLRAVNYRHLNLLQKCLLVSLLLHLLLTIGLSVWKMTQEISKFLAEGGQTTQVNLELAREMELKMRLRRQVSDLPVAEESLADLARAEPMPAPRATPTATELNIPRSQWEPMSVKTVQPEAPRPLPPVPTERLSLPPPMEVAVEPQIHIDQAEPIAAAEARPQPPAVRPPPSVRRAVRPAPRRPAAHHAEAAAARLQPEPARIRQVTPNRPKATTAEPIHAAIELPPQPALLPTPADVAPAPVQQMEASQEPGEIFAAPQAQKRRPAAPRMRPGPADVAVPAAILQETSPAETIADAPRTPTTRPAPAIARTIRPEAPPPDQPPVEATPADVAAAPVRGAPSQAPGVPLADAKAVKRPTASPHTGPAASPYAVPSTRITDESRVPAISTSPRPAADAPTLRAAVDLPILTDTPAITPPEMAGRPVRSEERPPMPGAPSAPTLKRRRLSAVQRRSDQALDQADRRPARTDQVGESLADRLAINLPRRRATRTVTERVAPDVPPVEIPQDLGPGRLASPPSLFHRSYEQRKQLLRDMGGSKESEQAVSRALAYLAANQQRDGRWTALAGRRRRRRGREQTDPALTGLAALCFLAANHTPARPGTYRETTAKALDFLLDQGRDDGDFRGGGDMYNQAIVTLALAEAASMTGDAKYGRAAVKGAQFIVRAQNPSLGGWRYEPRRDSDTSVFGWQVMALHSVERLGYHIPDECRRKALRWLRSVSRSRHRMLCSYQGSRTPTPAMTAEAAFSYMLLGKQLSEAEQKEACDYLLAHPPDRGTHNYYYWYYASLALMQLQNEAWEKWNAKMRDFLRKLQRRQGSHEGSWEPDSKYARRNYAGRIYTTTLATLTLEVYYRYLPMYGSGPKKP